MEFGIDRRIATFGIDSKGGGRASTRNRVANLARDSDGSNPGQRVRKIAETFAEIDGRRVGIEGICSEASRACPAPFDAEAHRHHKLIRRLFDDAVFERGLKILKPVRSDPGQSPGRAKMAVG